MPLLLVGSTVKSRVFHSLLQVYVKVPKPKYITCIIILLLLHFFQIRQHKCQCTSIELAHVMHVYYSNWCLKVLDKFQGKYGNIHVRSVIGQWLSIVLEV